MPIEDFFIDLALALNGTYNRNERSITINGRKHYIMTLLANFRLLQKQERDLNS